MGLNKKLNEKNKELSDLKIKTNKYHEEKHKAELQYNYTKNKLTQSNEKLEIYFNGRNISDKNIIEMNEKTNLLSDMLSKTKENLNNKIQENNNYETDLY